jgi:Gliding motility associated protein GldN
MRRHLTLKGALFVFCIFSTVFLFGQKLHVTTTLEGYKCIYHETNGMLNGNYISYYKNGVKKSEGSFSYNKRIGEWIVWDSTGKLRVKRNFTSPLEFKRTYPEIPNDGPIPLLSSPDYILQRDTNGCWKQFQIEQRAAFYQQRNFKTFYTTEKQLFFEYETLYKILYKNVTENNCAGYATGDSEDETYKSRYKATEIDSSGFNLVGFRLKSDFIFDDNHMLSDERPLFITVLVQKKTGAKDTIDFFSVYYRELRKYLAKIKLSTPRLPLWLQNLDDVFTFGCVGFQKYKVSAVYDRLTGYTYYGEKAFTKCLIKEAETENDIWLHFNK